MSAQGVIIYGAPSKYPENLPDELKVEFSGKTSQEILGNLQLWARIDEYVGKSNLGIGEVLGVSIERYSWEQKEQIDARALD